VVGSAVLSAFLNLSLPDILACRHHKSLRWDFTVLGPGVVVAVDAIKPRRVRCIASLHSAACWLRLAQLVKSLLTAVSHSTAAGRTAQVYWLFFTCGAATADCRAATKASQSPPSVPQGLRLLHAVPAPSLLPPNPDLHVALTPKVGHATSFVLAFVFAQG
jgi:hypothetical protein